MIEWVTNTYCRQVCSGAIVHASNVYLPLAHLLVLLYTCLLFLEMKFT